MFPIPLLQLFRFVLELFKKRVNAILTGRLIGKTYTEYRREFVEHFPYGKQTGNFLDQQKHAKTSPGPKTDFLGSVI